MAVLKFSQVTVSPSNPVAADTFMGVHGGNTDYQFTGTQLLAFTNANLPGSFTGFANPSAAVGLTAVNGSATTAMRSDGASALDQTINPAMSGTWVFSNSISATNGYKIGGVLILNANATNSGTFVGQSAGALLLSTDTKDTAVGFQAMAVATGSGADSGNSAFGYRSLTSLTTGKHNTGIGDGTIFSATDAISNTAVGKHAMLTSNGSGNTVIGYLAMDLTAAGTNNVVIGLNAGRNVTGTSNVLIGGTTAGITPALVAADNNVAIGDRPLNTCISGGNNVAIGRIALFSTLGSNNVAIGQAAGQNATGNGGVFIGNNAGLNETGAAKLYIANTNTANPLIGGDFTAGTLNFGTFGGVILFGGVPAAAPVAQILQVQNAATGNNNGAATFTQVASLAVGNGTSGDAVFSTGKNGNGSGVLATITEALRIKGETQAVVVAAGKTFQIGNAAVTALVPGALAATTNASIVITDSGGQAYRIPCII